MPTNPVTNAVHSGGRIAVWLVIALLALAAVYALAMVLLNWNAIGV